MKSLKIKVLTLGILSTLIVSSTPVFAATSNSTINTKTNISTQSTIKYHYTWCAGKTTASAVNFRTGPGTDYGIICVIYDKGSFLNIDLNYPTTNGFMRVMYNDTIGYIYSDYAQTTTLP